MPLSCNVAYEPHSILCATRCCQNGVDLLCSNLIFSLCACQTNYKVFNIRKHAQTQTLILSQKTNATVQKSWSSTTVVSLHLPLTLTLFLYLSACHIINCNCWPICLFVDFLCASSLSQVLPKILGPVPPFFASSLEALKFLGIMQLHVVCCTLCTHFSSETLCLCLSNL